MKCDVCGRPGNVGHRLNGRVIPPLCNDHATALGRVVERNGGTVEPIKAAPAKKPAQRKAAPRRHKKGRNAGCYWMFGLMVMFVALVLMRII